ncbi:DUF4194 domain-containing protein [Paraburkholderia oxyphila]|uniref:DUF4194 domain-containing protein n=1 Tax=Paraburkholderia oxyphila TaxID=614212 RepID=UPI0004843F71|nr:DUF4194 domain-containing protein [Paraburkholderia oxyphila]
MKEERQEATLGDAGLSILSITLLKGVIYREDDERTWAALLDLQARVRDYVTILGLELVLDEAEGYAFVKSRPEPGKSDTDNDAPRLPRLVARRPLSFPVSLLLALLRKKLAESDAGGGDTRLVLTRDEIVELIRVFLPDSSNEAKLVDQIDTQINKIVELGFLRRMKTTGGPSAFEVRRILKAFVDAQWLLDFDARLAAYRTHIDATATPAAKSEASDE